MMRSFYLAAFAQLLFGAAASSITAIQRVLVAYHMEDSLAFSTALYVTMACLSKFIGKGFMGPIAVGVGFNWALLMPLFFCCLSTCSYMLFTQHFKEDVKSKEEIRPFENDNSELILSNYSVDGIHYVELASTIPSSTEATKKLVSPRKVNYFQRKRQWERRQAAKEKSDEEAPFPCLSIGIDTADPKFGAIAKDDSKENETKENETKENETKEKERGCQVIIPSPERKDDRKKTEKDNKCPPQSVHQYVVK